MITGGQPYTGQNPFFEKGLHAHDFRPDSGRNTWQNAQNPHVVDEPEYREDQPANYAVMQKKAGGKAKKKDEAPKVNKWGQGIAPKNSLEDPWREGHYRFMDEQDWLDETNKNTKGYELDEDDFEYTPVLQEEKLAKFREELEEEIVARAKKDAKEAEHKLHHS